MRTAASLVLSTLLAAVAGAQTENTLVLVADDLGVDVLASYGVGTATPATPALDALAAGGVRFTNAWSYPVCSPTRAALQTGRYGFRTGIGHLVFEGEFALPTAEVTIPEMLDALTSGGVAHAAIGKWHLGNASVGGDLSPNVAGYGHFSGVLGNLEGGDDYFSWPRVVDGAPSTCTTYATTQQVDDALAWIATAPEPWFCYVAFTAPHYPYQAPPAALHSVDLTGAGDPLADPRPYYEAMVEALDTEVGRLLAGLGAAGANTNVVFLGDNGTPPDVAVGALDPKKAKNTLFEGGVNVPLIVNGPAVASPGRTSDALVDASDLFATVAELVGVDPALALPIGTTLDSTSFVPVLADPLAPSPRALAFSEKFLPNGATAGLPVPAPPSPIVCQQNLGYQGPGNVTLLMCGQVLAEGNTSNLLLTDAVPFSPGYLAVALTNNPTVVTQGGTVVPYPPLVVLPFVTDQFGQIVLWSVKGVGAFGFLDIFAQAIVADGSLPLGWAFTNALRIEMLPNNSKTVRDARYKLVSSVNAGPQRFYDLALDPGESNDLLQGTLTAAEQSAFDALDAALDGLLQNP